jgi:hypothetical protein
MEGDLTYEFQYDSSRVLPGFGDRTKNSQPMYQILKY